MAVTFTPFTSVAVFGGLAIDRIAVTGAAPTLGASNPGRVRAAPGGVGFNVAVSLARLGLKVRFVGAIGDDPDGRLMLAAARGAGINTGSIVVDPRLPTATYQAVFDDRGDLVVGVADTGIYDALAPATMANSVNVARTDAFWIVDANFPSAILALLLREAEAAGRPVAALPISPAKSERFAALDRRPTLLFANRREAAAMLGHQPDGAKHDPAELAAGLGRTGFGNVLVTNSAESLHAASAGVHRTFAPPRVSVANVNGAGDALAAGTIYGLSLGRSLFDAVRLGLAAATLNVESDQTVRSDLTPALLAERIVEGVGP